VLREKLPKDLWAIINKVFVCHGQACCKPIGPLCHQCPIEQYCQKIGVKPKAILAPKKKPSKKLLKSLMQ
jgi:endonuclease-3